MSKPRRTCPQCGAMLFQDAPKGLCPKCLLGEGLFHFGVNAQASSLSEQPDKIGRYKILQKIGEGGCGKVYVAEQEIPVRRRVAIKVIKLGMDTENVIARFEAERQALAIMDHPNIAKVLDAGATDTGRPYFVMELVRGTRITDYCDENHLATKERLYLFIKVCQAIQHAHQKGIIHRDIKPSNILVTLHDGVAVPKVIDFGIAKATEGRLTAATVYTQLQQFIGTPAYMSPEQAEMTGFDIDTRSDVYSLGVLLYELLTGRTPFDAKELLKSSTEEMRQIIREREPVRPSTRVSSLVGEELAATAKHRHTGPPQLIHFLKGDLDWIAMKCLEKDRTRRYETANGIAADVNRYLSNEPIAARPPSTAYRTKKLLLKHKAIAATTLIIFCCASAAAIISSVSLISEREARRTLKKEKDAAEAARQEAVAQRALAQRNFEVAKANEDQAQRALYAADMLLVEQAASEGNLGHAVNLLEKYNSSTNRARDLRGWEWYYYKNSTLSGELFTLAQMPDTCTAVSEDSKGRLAILTERGVLRLYDPDSRRLLKSTQLSYEGVLMDYENIRLLHSRDDRFLLVSSRPNLYLLDGETLAVIRTRRFQEPRPIEALNTSDDGKTLLVNTGDAIETLSLPDLISIEADSIPPSFRVFLSPNKKLAFLNRSDLSPDRQVEFWNLASLSPVITGLQYYWGRTVGSAFSPDGRWFVQAGYTGSIVRETTTGSIVQTLPLTRDWAAAWSPDSSLVALGASADQKIHIYRTGSWERVTMLQGHHNEVTVLCFSRDGKRIYSGDKSGVVKVWSAKTFETPTSHAELNAPLISRDANYAFVQSEAGGTLYRLPGLEPVRKIPLGTNASSVVLSPNGGAYAALEADRIVILRTADGRLKHELSVPTNILCLALSGELCAAASSDKFYLWDLGKTNPPRSAGFSFPPYYRPKNIILSPLSDRAAIVAGDVIALLSLGDLSSPKLLKGHQTLIATTAFSPDGKLLASASFDASVRVWNAEAGTVLQTLRGQRYAQISVAFSHDGSRLAAGGADGTIWIWETLGWHQVALLRHSETNSVNALAFGADDHYLAATSPRFCKIFQAPRE